MRYFIEISFLEIYFGFANCAWTMVYLKCWNDNEFFSKLDKLSGQALHAKTLEFTHPKTKKWMSFNSDLPKGFKNILSLLENLSGWNNKFYI